MVTRTLSFGQSHAAVVHAHLADAIESTPDDAVVQLRITGPMPAMLTAATLRAIAGTRTVMLAVRPADRSGNALFTCSQVVPHWRGENRMALRPLGWRSDANTVRQACRRD
jgi:hypothetical protein